MYSQASAVRKSLPSCIFFPCSNGGRPRYGQPAHRKASPREQLPHEDWGLSSISCVSFTRSPAASFSARPHEQFLQALREVLQSPAAGTSGLALSSSVRSSSSSSISSSSLFSCQVLDTGAAGAGVFPGRLRLKGAFAPIS
eukprot:CAMPEP_0202407168 /NCGR_PEP_ID=MMETSP1128-20130828/11463_1 /ASSEMBLY_ACC=CAM_ASM_000463 /TAXON_ID=3047 /ORGANISM="Dunaliella tertiolecta, Strain CCMP1320" /LENGTH=140 /DNA_ID=CAMNT_0049012113 /DNA_START=421 /DNA_END=843 /DNA_ORIENTATION=+